MLRKELETLKCENEELRRKVAVNKQFMYMVIHDLKHPTEALIMQLDVLRKKLAKESFESSQRNEPVED